MDEDVLEDVVLMFFGGRPFDGRFGESRRFGEEVLGGRRFG